MANLNWVKNRKIKGKKLNVCETMLKKKKIFHDFNKSFDFNIFITTIIFSFMTHPWYSGRIR
jgi:hypothetical protein